MPSRYMRRTILCVAPALAAGVLAACGGRGPLDTDIESYDSADAAGLTTPGDDEIEPGGDSGTRPTKPLDGGADSKEAGTPGSPGSPGLPGLPGLSADAGGIVGCFACAEDSCGTQVNACVGSPACVEEGTCDLMCLGGGTTGGGLADGGTTGGGLAGGGLAGGGLAGLGGLNLSCFQSCTKDQQASQELLTAVTCTFGSCGTQCLSALGGAGGGLGGLAGGGLAGGALGGLGGTLGGLGGLGGLAPVGAATAAGP